MQGSRELAISSRSCLSESGNCAGWGHPRTARIRAMTPSSSAAPRTASARSPRTTVDPHGTLNDRRRLLSPAIKSTKPTIARLFTGGCRKPTIISLETGIPKSVDSTKRAVGLKWHPKFPKVLAPGGERAPERRIFVLWQNSHEFCRLNPAFGPPAIPVPGSLG